MFKMFVKKPVLMVYRFNEKKEVLDMLSDESNALNVFYKNEKEVSSFRCPERTCGIPIKVGFEKCPYCGIKLKWQFPFEIVKVIEMSKIKEKTEDRKMEDKRIDKSMVDRIYMTGKKDLVKWFIEQHKKIQEDIQGKIQCACCKGCSKCCTHAIAVYKPEIYIIKNRILSMDVETQERIKEKLAEQVDILRANDLFTVPNSNFSIELYMAKYIALNMPCVFQTENHECLIYDIRPISCVTHVQLDNKNNCEDGIYAKGIINLDDYDRAVRDRFIQAGLSMHKSRMLILPTALLQELR